MSTQLRSGRNWTNKIRLSDDKPKLDVKRNKVHAAVAGRMIRDINNGDFDNIPNLQLAADTVDFTDTSAQGKTVIGFYNITTVQPKDPKASPIVVHDDSTLVDHLCDQGGMITNVQRKDIMG